MRSPTQIDEKVARLQHKYGWTEEEARRFLQRAKRMLVNDIVFDRPLTAAERREIGVDAKFGDELDELDGVVHSTDQDP